MNLTPEQQKALRSAWEACIDDPTVEFSTNTARELKKCVLLPDGRHRYTWCSADESFARVW